MKSVEATVVKHTGSHYILSILPSWNPFPAVIRGHLRQHKAVATNPVAVGDKVLCQVPDDFDAGAGIGRGGCRDGGGCSDGLGPCGAGVGSGASAGLTGAGLGGVNAQNPALITEVLPRRNYLIRRSTNLSREAHVIASNVDRAFVVVTLAFPEVKLPFLDRLLVTCEAYGIPVTIVLNKVDLLEEFPDMISHFEDIYCGAGYPVIRTSVRTGQGIEQLRQALCGGVNLLSGISGVGKSSIVKCLDPSLDPKTAPISVSHLQGRHTTTFYEMYPLCSGGFIIDTPGIRSFGLLDLPREEVALYFPEMLRVGKSCRFTPCTHTHEPGCAVKAAVEAAADAAADAGAKGNAVETATSEPLAVAASEVASGAASVVADACAKGKAVEAATSESLAGAADAARSMTVSPERYNSYLGMLEEQTKYR